MSAPGPGPAPVPAAPPGLKTYAGEALDVTFDPAACVHSGICVRGLREVFDTKRRPWVLPDAAAAEAVMDTIRRCPSGALKFVPKAGQPEETSDSPTHVEAQLDGPLYVRGDVEVRRPDGSTVRGMRFALCRCGQSQRKPFCDMSHKKVGFRDSPPDAPPDPAPPRPQVGPHGEPGTTDRQQG